MIPSPDGSLNEGSSKFRFVSSLRIFGCASRNCLTSKMSPSISCFRAIIPSTSSGADAQGGALSPGIL